MDFFKHWDRAQELERVMLGEIPGRRTQDEITVFFGPGVGLQLAALGAEVLRRAREKKVGRDLPTEWFVNA